MTVENPSLLDLDCKLDLTRKGNVLGKALVFLLIVCLIGAGSWFALNHFFPQHQDQKTEQKAKQTPSEPVLTQEEKEAEQKRILALEAEQRKQRAEELEAAEKLEVEKKKAREALVKKRRLERIQASLVACKKAIADKDWKLANKHLGALQDDEYDLVETAKLTTQIDQGKAEERAALLKVNDLIKQAQELDTGKYSVEAISKLDEALLLLPKHPEARALREKISNYTSEYKVPGDFKTLAELAPKLRPGDTVVLGEGKFEQKALLNLAMPIHLKGAGIEKTILLANTSKNSAMSLSDPAVNQTKHTTYFISNLTIRGTTYDDDKTDRHPLLVVNAHTKLEQVSIERSSGHGIAHIAGKLEMKKVNVTQNAWDGIHIIGKDSQAIITDCKVIENYDHGIDIHQGSKATITATFVNKNAGTGILVMGAGTQVTIEQVQMMENQQCGLVITQQAKAKIVRAFISKNRLSGLVVQGVGTQATFAMAVSNENGEAGYLIDEESTLKGFDSTTSDDNKLGDVIRKRKVKTVEPEPAVPE